ncbi:MAG: hypothetical protein JNL74_08370, partial [Fibrobacteres bacterium]|nr:hypothetical protein [Fibrobacterota bacterium]
MNSRTTIVLALIATVASFGAVTFTTQPSLTKDSQNRMWVDFAVSEYTDVAVTIVDMRDTSNVRHLAAGMLGANPPAPLTANTLSQHIEWNGKDDFGFQVSNPEIYKVRVQAGMKVKLRNTVGDNPYSFNGTSNAYGGSYAAGSGSGGRIYGMIAGSDGSVYVCGTPGPIFHQHEGW